MTANHVPMHSPVDDCQRCYRRRQRLAAYESRMAARLAPPAVPRRRRKTADTAPIPERRRISLTEVFRAILRLEGRVSRGDLKLRPRAVRAANREHQRRRALRKQTRRLRPHD